MATKVRGYKTFHLTWPSQTLLVPMEAASRNCFKHDALFQVPGICWGGYPRGGWLEKSSCGGEVINYILGTLGWGAHSVQHRLLFYNHHHHHQRLLCYHHHHFNNTSPLTALTHKWCDLPLLELEFFIFLRKVWFLCNSDYILLKWNTNRPSINVKKKLFLFKVLYHICYEGQIFIM